MLRPAELDRKDVDVIRKGVFSNNTFYVTSITQVCSAVCIGCPSQWVHPRACSNRLPYQWSAYTQGLQHDSAGITLSCHSSFQYAMYSCLRLVQCV